MTSKEYEDDDQYHLIKKKDLAKIVGATLLLPALGPAILGGAVGAKLGAMAPAFQNKDRQSRKSKHPENIRKDIWDNNFRDILDELLEDFEIDGKITDFEYLVIKILRRAEFSEEEQKALAHSIDTSVNSIIRGRLERPKVAPELWVNRDKSLGEEPHEFIERVYGSYIEAGSLLRADIRALDDPLNSALARQEKNPKRAPPSSFYLPKQQDGLGDDPDADVKKGGHEGRQASARSRWK